MTDPTTHETPEAEEVEALAKGWRALLATVRAEHEVNLRGLWLDLADSEIEAGVDWPGVVRSLFADLDLLAAGYRKADPICKDDHAAWREDIEDAKADAEMWKAVAAAKADPARDAAAVEYVHRMEKCTERSCGTRVRFSELTDDVNTHWHLAPGVGMVPVSALADPASDAELRAVLAPLTSAVHQGQGCYSIEGWFALAERVEARLRAALTEAGDEDIAAKIERSSLGTPEAQALRATVTDEHAARIVAAARRLDEAADLHAACLTALEQAKAVLAAGTPGPWTWTRGDGEDLHFGRMTFTSIYAGRKNLVSVVSLGTEDAAKAVSAVNTRGAGLALVEAVLDLHKPYQLPPNGHICAGHHPLTPAVWPCPLARAAALFVGVVLP